MSITPPMLLDCIHCMGHMTVARASYGFPKQYTWECTRCGEGFSSEQLPFGVGRLADQIQALEHELLQLKGLVSLMEAWIQNEEHNRPCPTT